MIKIDIKQTGQNDNLDLVNDLDLAIFKVVKKHKADITKDQGVNMYGYYNRLEIKVKKDV